MITLCFDFGNTRQKCAVFNKDKLTEIIILTEDLLQSVPDLLKKYHPYKTILSSVINHDPAIDEILRTTASHHQLSARSRLPFTTPVSKPETIGADRLAASAAACSLFRDQNNLVIVLGSCITYNMVNKYRQFLGGGISPGMEMRFKSLNTFTARLPLISPVNDIPLIGYDTRTNILSGVIIGMAKEIDGVIDEYSKKYLNFNVLLTGGDIAYFARHLKNKIFADPDLIFKGLYAISEHNEDIKI
ncbi:type III pantothenate kinase [soil metagenome]